MNTQSKYGWLMALLLLTACDRAEPPLIIDRSDYAQRLQGFWLGQNIANWTGLITEMDKIGTPETCLLYTSPSPRDLSTSRMPSSA